MTRQSRCEELEARIADLEARLRKATADAGSRLQDSSVLAAALISSPGNLIISRLKDGLILDISDSFTETIGYQREEVVGRTVVDIGLWTNKEDRRKFVDLLRKKGEVRGFRAHITTKDGRILFFDISGRQVEIGGEDCVVSNSRDISELLQQEITLRKQVGTLDSILRAAPTGIGMVRGHVIVEANQRLCEMTGYCRRELIDQSMRMLSPSREDFEWLGKEKQDQIDGQAAGYMETRWRCKDGRIIDVWLSSAAIDPQDPDFGITFTALDITARKANERTLELQASYLAALHETALGLVSHLEPDEVLKAIVENAVELVDGAEGVIFLRDDRTDELVVRAGTGHYTKRMLDFRIKVGEGLAGSVARSGKPMWVDDYSQWPERFSNGLFDELHAALGIPILSQREVVGVLGMTYFGVKKKFYPEEIQILSRFADLAAIALENARLYSRVQMELKEKQRVEAALRRSEQQYRAVFDNTGTGTVLSEQDTTLSMVNQGFADLVGYTRGEIEGRMKWTDLIDPADHARMLEIHYLRRKDPDAAPKTFECGLIDRHGVRKDVMLKVDLIPGTTTSVGSFADITPIKKAAQILRKYEQMVTSSSDYMALLDRDYVFQVVNSPYSVVMGRAVENIIGRPAAEIFGRDLFEHHQKPKIDQSLDGQELRFKAWYDTPGLGRRYIDTAYYPSRDEDDTISGVVIVGRDITDLRKLEGQLLQAQKMDAIGTLAGGLAHDFNNLLMGIQGRTSLMMSEVDPGHPFHEHLEGIESYVKSAVDLTRQILGFARGGRYEIKPTDLNELVKTQNRMFSRTRREVTVRGRYAKDLWTVEVDRGQINQVLLNLYVNAWQAMPGGGELLVTTENLALTQGEAEALNLAAGRFVRVTVTDNGVGMDEKVMARIFEPFFTTREMGRGTGLGLASAYGIIKNHGGLINVSSEMGEGSTFTIYLPASRRAAERKTVSPEKPSTPGQGSLLLVDDEQMILDVGAAMLRKLGYTVHLAGSGGAALQLYQDRGDVIDLVILDMVMPGMGGGEVFDRLKAMDPGVKVVLSSGYSMDGKASEIMARGCAGFIQKPFNLTQLSEKVLAALAS